MCKAFVFEVIDPASAPKILLGKGSILVKRLPMANARFEVLDISPNGDVTMRRLDGDKRLRGTPVVIGGSHLKKHGYLIESDAAPHPMEKEKKKEMSGRPEIYRKSGSSEIERQERQAGF